jgi:hypothetical protein
MMAERTHNAERREELVSLARQKPRYGYRRLHALLARRGYAVSAQCVYRLYRSEVPWAPRGKQLFATHRFHEVALRRIT